MKLFLILFRNADQGEIHPGWGYLCSCTKTHKRIWRAPCWGHSWVLLYWWKVVQS